MAHTQNTNATISAAEKLARPPLPRWTVPVVAAAVLAISSVVLVLLWRELGTLGMQGKELATARLDAIKVVSSLAVGGGGGFALYLAARRQRTQELELAQREQAQSDTNADAEARRVTELYAKAVEQLGAEKAPVRLGGLYALERLAQDNPKQQQTIVNVLCAYLRMPYEIPDSDALNIIEPLSEEMARTKVELQALKQEREVRVAAQRILSGHLRPDVDESTGRPANPEYWGDRRVDLAGATLFNLELHDSCLGSADFTGATFIGDTSFYRTTFNGFADFKSATFKGATVSRVAIFQKATFSAFASFEGALFWDDVAFDDASFLDGVWFVGVKFMGDTSFQQTDCPRGISFGDATFVRQAGFSHSWFTHGVSFTGTTFQGRTFFNDAMLGAVSSFKDIKLQEIGDLDLNGAWGRTDLSSHRREWPSGWTLDSADTERDGFEGRWARLLRFKPGPDGTVPPVE